MIYPVNNRLFSDDFNMNHTTYEIMIQMITYTTWIAFDFCNRFSNQRFLFTGSLSETPQLSLIRVKAMVHPS